MENFIFCTVMAVKNTVAAALQNPPTRATNNLKDLSNIVYGFVAAELHVHL